MHIFRTLRTAQSPRRCTCASPSTLQYQSSLSLPLRCKWHSMAQHDKAAGLGPSVHKAELSKTGPLSVLESELICPCIAPTAFGGPTSVASTAAGRDELGKLFRILTNLTYFQQIQARVSRPHLHRRISYRLYQLRMPGPSCRSLDFPQILSARSPFPSYIPMCSFFLFPLYICALRPPFVHSSLTLLRLPEPWRNQCPSLVYFHLAGGRRGCSYYQVSPYFVTYRLPTVLISLAPLRRRTLNSAH